MDNKLREIEEALRKATPGKWEAKKREGTYGSGSFALYLGEYDFDGFEHHRAENAHLIANAPEWLRYQRSIIETQADTIKRLTEEVDAHGKVWEEMGNDLLKLREANDRLTEERDRWKKHATDFEEMYKQEHQQKNAVLRQKEEENERLQSLIRPPADA